MHERATVPSARVLRDAPLPAHASCCWPWRCPCARAGVTAPSATRPHDRGQRPRVTISIVATTDVHGHVESLPWFSGHVENVRAARRADGGGVLLVDAGDMWQGTLESNLGEGAAVVRAYNALRYDAVTIGNHEFDFGPVGPEHGAPRRRRQPDRQHRGARAPGDVSRSWRPTC